MANKDKNANKKPGAKKTNDGANKAKPKVKKCEGSLSDSVDFLWGSVAESVEDIQKMVVQALDRIEKNDIAAAKLLLEGTVIYIEDFLSEEECDDEDNEEDDDEDEEDDS